MNHTSKYRDIYLSLSDHINKYLYHLVDIPLETRNLTAYELSPYTAGPFDTPLPGEMSSGMFSINWMILSYYDRIPFTIANPSDMCHIAWKLGEYLQKLSTRLHELTDDEKNYYDKASEFYAVVNKGAERIVRKLKLDDIVGYSGGNSLFKEFMQAKSILPELDKGHIKNVNDYSKLYLKN